MAYGAGGRFIQPGYRRSIREHLHDQKVKIVQGISGRWMPSSKEMRMAKLGALKDVYKERMKQQQEPPTRKRRLQQAGIVDPAKSRYQSEQSAVRTDIVYRITGGEFGAQDPSVEEGSPPQKKRKRSNLLEEED